MIKRDLYMPTENANARYFVPVAGYNPALNRITDTLQLYSVESYRSNTAAQNKWTYRDVPVVLPFHRNIQLMMLSELT